MAKKEKQFRPKARLPKGFRDLEGARVVARRSMLERIRDVYELYGFEPLETPAIEYVDALGKFLPDVDRPMGGIFGFQDEDEQWMALRYDLTAPLARYVAENYDRLAKPYRRYQTGSVFRNEKPGVGRFREFTQFDADTVGTAEMAAEAELLAMLANALEAIGLPRGDYVIRLNNRKVLNGVLETIGVWSADEDANSALEDQRMTVLRAIDKLDRLGTEGVRLLLGEGRKDDSGDYTEGAKLSAGQIDTVMGFVEASGKSVLADLRALVGASQTGAEGIAELEEIAALMAAQGIDEDRAVIDPSVVRGLAYYTGPVFEAELTFETLDEKGQPRRFGSVASGGRYDGLVKRFTGRDVPATGVSIGVDRLLAALDALDRAPARWVAPVVVTAMDRERMADYQAMVSELRNAGIKAELYVGSSGMKAQLKYADRREAPIVVIAGSDEFEKGEITLKDLILGAELSKNIDDNKAWREDQPAQLSVARADLVAEVRKMLGRHGLH